MAMIKEALEFSQDLKETIDKVASHEAFCHNDWAGDDLKEVRKFARDYYRALQRGECAYCRAPLSLIAANNCHVEHIAPKSLYLEFIFYPKNLCTVCADCNAIKRAQEVIDEVPDTVVRGDIKRYPNASDSFKIFHPHFDEWDEHLIQFGKAYVDKTPKGARTIQICKLNRFFHKLGWDEETIEEFEVVQLMNEYIGSNNQMRRSKILNRLREILLPQ